VPFNHETDNRPTFTTPPHLLSKTAAQISPVITRSRTPIPHRCPGFLIASPQRLWAIGKNRITIDNENALLQSTVFVVARFLNCVPALTTRLTNTSPRYPLFHAQRVLLRSISLLLLSFLEASFAPANSRPVPNPAPHKTPPEIHSPVMSRKVLLST